MFTRTKKIISLVCDYSYEVFRISQDVYKFIRKKRYKKPSENHYDESSPSGGEDHDFSSMLGKGSEDE